MCIIISKSDVEICNNQQISNNTNTNKSELNCTTKLILSLSIENGKLEDSDSIEAYVTKVKHLTELV
jgi:hypothetical protein